MSFERNRKFFIEKFFKPFNLTTLTKPRSTPSPQIISPPPINKTPIEPTMVEENVLNIRSHAAWSEYRNKLDAVEALDNFAAEHFNMENFGISLNKFKSDIQKINPEFFNEETTEKIVDGVIKAAKNLVKALEDCDRAIKNPKRYSAPYVELRGLIEKYFERIEIKHMNFKPGDSYDDWADLGLTEQPGTESTVYISKYDTLKEVYVQPHYIEFIDEHGEEKRRVFGGKCAVYVRRR